VKSPTVILGPARRALALSALTGAFFAALLGLAADRATAAYTANVDAGTLKIIGDSASDRLTLQLAPGAPGILQVDVGSDGTADFSFDRSTFTAIEVRGRRGDDEIRVNQSFGTFADEALTMNGGSGNDTLLGGSGREIFIGGGGDDVIAGGDADDTAFMGGGADRFTWNAGDDNDIVEGQAGSDTLDFNGANIGESIGVSANGPRVRFTRSIANITMDLDDVEHVGFDAVGGADTVTVTDLAGTDAESVDVDLNAFGGGGDGQIDTVIARGSDGDDTFGASSSPGGVHVSGLSAIVNVVGGELVNDSANVEGGLGSDTLRYSGTPGDDEIALVANGAAAAVTTPGAARIDSMVESVLVLGLAGADTMSGTGDLAPLTTITMDGGDGPDSLRGGNGADLMLGGDGDDLIDGNQGLDTALMGSGDDHFQWDPGDGNDVVEGQTGADVLDFNGSNIGELIDVFANGPRVFFTRNIGNITMDLDDVERLNFRALGGADNVVVNDLTGTDARDVDVDLNASVGGGDGQPDSVTVRGTDGADDVSLSSPGGFATVSGLYAEVLVESAESANDDVNVATLGGADTITTGREVFGPASYNVDGGDGDDVTRYSGTSLADTIQVASNGTEVSTSSALAARLDTTAVESLVILGLGGTDTIAGVGNLAPLTTITMDGGDDRDTLLGGNGADLLLGGDGDDHVDGNQGADRALMGSGDDRFQWDPGDGNDVVEGQTGADVLDFNGSNIGEIINVLANGRRGLLLRNIGNITMDFNGVEGVLVHARGGNDAIEAGDLAGTNVDSVDVDLGADGSADTVVVTGTTRRDVVAVTRSGSEVLATGLHAQTRIVGGEPTLDTLVVQTLSGNDDVTVAPDVSDLIATIVDLGGDD
jgi:Ca2+-binding RTX toxin-like protein